MRLALGCRLWVGLLGLAFSWLRAESADLAQDRFGIVREELPTEENALPRLMRVTETLPRLGGDIEERFSQLPYPTISPETQGADLELIKWVGQFDASWEELGLKSTEKIQFPRIEGPETPFPAHQILQRLVNYRAAAAKLKWMSGHRAESLKLAGDNLRLCEAWLSNQEGIISLISASGAWKTSLDTVYWLACQPEFLPTHGRQLINTLESEKGLAGLALRRAFQGEMAYVHQVVLERFPQTNDINRLLQAVSTFGADSTLPSDDDGQNLQMPTDYQPFNMGDTLAMFSYDLNNYVSCLQKKPDRLPRELGERETGPRLAQLHQELGSFYTYACVDAHFDAEFLNEVQNHLANVTNPVGKLYVILNTPSWDALMITVYRREAERQAMLGLLGWRAAGQVLKWDELCRRGLLTNSPCDPFSDTDLLMAENPLRIWSVGADGIDQRGLGDGGNWGGPEDLAWPVKLAPENGPE